MAPRLPKHLPRGRLDGSRQSVETPQPVNRCTSSRPVSTCIRYAATLPSMPLRDATNTAGDWAKDLPDPVFGNLQGRLTSFADDFKSAPATAIGSVQMFLPPTCSGHAGAVMW